MRTTSVFVDTSGWMAYLVAAEDYHALATQELDQALDNPGFTIYITDHVIAELVALMNSRRISRPQLLRDVDSLLIAPKILKLFTDQSLFSEAWKLLKRAQTKSGHSRTLFPSVTCSGLESRRCSRTIIISSRPGSCVC